MTAADAATGIGAVDKTVLWIGAIVVITSGLGLLLQIVRLVARVVGRMDDFWEDWQGTADRPGVPGRPGVLVRLGKHDEQLADHEGRLIVVERQVAAPPPHPPV